MVKPPCTTDTARLTGAPAGPKRAAGPFTVSVLHSFQPSIHTLAIERVEPLSTDNRAARLPGYTRT